MSESQRDKMYVPPTPKEKHLILCISTYMYILYEYVYSNKCSINNNNNKIAKLRFQTSIPLLLFIYFPRKYSYQELNSVYITNETRLRVQAITNWSNVELKLIQSTALRTRQHPNSYKETSFLFPARKVQCCLWLILQTGHKSRSSLGFRGNL